MTDEEIIKDLTELNLYTGFQEKYVQALNAALDLIIHQKAEIEKLTKKVEELSEVLSDTIRIRYAEAKSEAYKEFAKRLKNKIKTECNPYGKPTFDYDTSISIMRYIDNLVKEMVGDIEWLIKKLNPH